VSTRRIAGKADGDRHVVEIDKRQRAARQLLGTAIGIAIEGGEDAGNVETAGTADRERHRCGARHELCERIGADRQLAAGRKGNIVPPRHRKAGRADPKS
jgi:hypothetical protein